MGRALLFVDIRGDGVEVCRAVLEGLEGVVFWDYGRDDVMSFEHVHGLRLDDSHEDLCAAGLYVLNSFFHGVESALVHEGNETHAYDDNLGIGGHVGHDLLELVDGAEEYGSVESLDVDFVSHGVGHAVFVVPRAFLVEVGEFLAAVAALDEVGGAFHEEYTGDDHADTASGE